MTKWPNKPAAGNAGIARQLTIEHYWPGVGEPERLIWLSFCQAGSKTLFRFSRFCFGHGAMD
jgi:hypothetical protein